MKEAESAQFTPYSYSCLQVQGGSFLKITLMLKTETPLSEAFSRMNPQQQVGKKERIHLTVRWLTVKGKQKSVKIQKVDCLESDLSLRLRLWSAVKRNY